MMYRQMDYKELPAMLSPCKSCPFRKDSLKGWLGESRIEEILEAESFVCHKDTSKQCAGHMLITEYNNSFYRLAKTTIPNFKLKGKELVFDSIEDCVNHHR